MIGCIDQDGVVRYPKFFKFGHNKANIIVNTTDQGMVIPGLLKVPGAVQGMKWKLFFVRIQSFLVLQRMEAED